MFNPPDPSVFNKLVWQIVKQIPAGKVSSYGQIASMIDETLCNRSNVEIVPFEAGTGISISGPWSRPIMSFWKSLSAGPSMSR